LPIDGSTITNKGSDESNNIVYDGRDASASNNDREQKTGKQRISDMLSSHPATSERIKHFEPKEGETP
jgi:Zn-dependent protease with chaperone function